MQGNFSYHNPTKLYFGDESLNYLKDELKNFGPVVVLNYGSGTAKPHDTDYQIGPQWWTDSYVPDDYWHNCAGARYQYIVREDIMRDWAQRWAWLKE